MSESSDLMRTLEVLHQAGLDGSHWPDALEAVAALAGADGASIHILDRATGRSSGLLIGTHQDARRTWAAYYAGLPRLGPGLTSPVDAVLLDREVAARPARTGKGYLQDFALGRNFYDGMTSMIGRVTREDGSVYGSVVFSRRARRGAYGRDDADRIARVTPHLRRALEVGQRLATAQGASHSVGPLLERLPQGALLLDQDARVLLANEIARRLLSAQNGLAASSGILRADTPAETAALGRLVASVLHRSDEKVPPELILRRRSGDAPLSILAVPLPRNDRWFVLSNDPAVLVLVTDPEQRRRVSAARLRDLYGLTSAEARIAAAVAQGDGLPVVARANGISPTTARTHLKHIFEKTGARRQAQLAWLVASVAGDPGE